MRIYNNLELENMVIQEKYNSIEQLYIKGELWRSIQFAYAVEEFFIEQGDSALLPSLYNSMGNNLKRQKDWRDRVPYAIRD